MGGWNKKKRRDKGYGSSTIGGIRLRELKDKNEAFEDVPGLFSKVSRITVVSNMEDTKRSVTLEEAIEFSQKKRSDKSMWIDFQGLSDEDMKKVEVHFNLHPLTSEDCMLPDTREKYEFFEHYYLVIVNELHYVPYSNILNNVNLCIVVFPSLILTFHISPLQTFHEVARKLSYEGQIPSPDWMLYNLIDGIVDIYVMLVELIVREADSLDDLVLLLTGVDQTELLGRIGNANRHAGFLKSGLWGKHEILSTLKESEKISENIRLYMQNVADHVVRCDQKLKLARQTLGSLHSAYLSKVSIELADQSNHMNVVMRRLSVITTAFLPLTLLSGIFGMNVRVPGMVGFDDSPKGYGWFIGIIIAMVIICIFMSTVFRWKKWL